MHLLAGVAAIVFSLGTVIGTMGGSCRTPPSSPMTNLSDLRVSNRPGPRRQYTPALVARSPFRLQSSYPPTGASAQLVVSGLATVDMDVWLAVEISHPRRTDLKVYLQNPAGTEVLVAAPTEAGPDLWIDVPVLGFSGDESVNGVWTVRVVDSKAAKQGILDNVKLTVGSRWD